MVGTFLIHFAATLGTWWTILAIADADQSDPFDLNLEEYAKQLVAGTSHTLPDLGLRVDMPDYASLAGSEVSRKRDQRRRP